jgi:hypothetical protein
MDPCSGVTFDTSRIDPITGNILRYSQTGCSYSPHEIMYDSLRARLNDTINAQCAINSPVRCLDTISVLLFGQIRSRKSFGEPFHEGFGPHSYVRGIGFSGASAYGQSCSVTISIKGCVLNGFVYGDTSFIVGVKQISTEVPEEFSLSQNYPNPFNPTTKIKFSIPLSRGVPRFTSGRGVSVKLTIYDLLGREVATLVNEQLKPGTYEVEWDGTNYPSGVYFYKLTAGDALAPLSSTKKMVLLK